MTPLILCACLHGQRAHHHAIHRQRYFRFFGLPVTLSWQVSGAAYVIISPGVGAVRGTSVSVSPTANTTYTLYAANAFC